MSSGHRLLNKCLSGLPKKDTQAELLNNGWTGLTLGRKTINIWHLAGFTQLLKIRSTGDPLNLMVRYTKAIIRQLSPKQSLIKYKNNWLYQPENGIRKYSLLRLCVSAVPAGEE